MSKIKHLGEVKNIKISTEIEGKILNFNPETAVIVAYDKGSLINLCNIHSSIDGTKKIIEQLKNYIDILENQIIKKVKSNMDLIEKSSKYYKNNDIEGFKKACKDGELQDMPEDVALEMEKHFFEEDLN
jgi:hypothetical protein